MLTKSAIKHPFPHTIAIIGAGGVGSYLLPALLRTVRNHEQPDRSPRVIVIDGDTLEERNMERQLFSQHDIGQNKAVALVAKYSDYYPNLIARSEFFTGGESEEAIPMGTLLIGCVDNHPGRARILQLADMTGCDVIICGNGYTDAEAMFYSPAWRDSPADPRVIFPEILTTQGGDPLAPQGCTGEAQMAAPQLAIANYLAAGYALHLMWFYYQEAEALDEDTFKEFCPIRHASNMSQISTSKGVKPAHVS